MDPFFSLVNTASRDIALLACFWTAEPFADLPPLAEEASKSAITDYRSLHEPTEESDSRRRRSLEIHKGRMQNGESAGREGQEDSASTPPTHTPLALRHQVAPSILLLSPKAYKGGYAASKSAAPHPPSMLGTQGCQQICSLSPTTRDPSQD